MSKSTDKRFEAINRLLENLLGPVEDWTGDELDQFLAKAGVDMDAASRNLYDRVNDIAGGYRGRNEDIPQPVAELLRQMRPPDLPTSDPEVAKTAARKWIVNLRRPKPQVAVAQLAYAFRNKKAQIASKDKAVLEDLETKLKNRKRSDER
jgi:hypothetical protein